MKRFFVKRIGITFLILVALSFALELLMAGSGYTGFAMVVIFGFGMPVSMAISSITWLIQRTACNEKMRILEILIPLIMLIPLALLVAFLL